jgi:hypothetical protein
MKILKKKILAKIFFKFERTWFQPHSQTELDCTSLERCIKLRLE